MLFTRLPAASLLWRLFAVLVTVSAGPMLIGSLGVSGSNIARNSAFGIQRPREAISQKFRNEEVVAGPV